MIRCDASPSIGIGHLMRCLVLADAWRAAGGRAVFAMAADLGRDRLAAHELAPLASEGDPAEVIALAARTGARWVVIDHYGLDAAYLGALAGAGLQTLAIDDLAAHAFPVDVLVNSSADATRDQYRLAPHTRCLLGPEFALVRDVYRRARPARPAGEPLETVLVSFGGSDPEDRTLAVVTALALLARPPRICAVLGPGYAGRIAETQAIVVRRDLADLAQPMRTSQLMIGAGGSTAWEACCLGLPMILWPFVANQQGLAASLARLGAAALATDASDVAARIAALTPATLAHMAGAAWDLVDGDGATRILMAT